MNFFSFFCKFFLFFFFFSSAAGNGVSEGEMEQFQLRNQLLVIQLEETSAAWDRQLKSLEEERTRQSDEISRLQRQLSESRGTSTDLSLVKKELGETKKRLLHTESVAQEKTVQAQSLKSLVDMMKSEAQQKDVAMKAVQKQLNDNSASLAKRVEELECSNVSMRDEIDTYRNAPDRSALVFEPILLDKDAEISRLRDLLEASLEESISTVILSDFSHQTDESLGAEWPDVSRRPASRNAEVQTDSERGPVLPVVLDGGKGESGLEDVDVSTWRLGRFGVDGDSRDSGMKWRWAGDGVWFCFSLKGKSLPKFWFFSSSSGNNSKTPEPEVNLLSWNVPASSADISSARDSDNPKNSSSRAGSSVHVQLQTDLDNLDSLLTQIAAHKASIRELEHSLSQKELHIEAMALELASLSERHGKTQSKHRATIRHLNLSGQSSSDEGSTNSLPRPNGTTDVQQLAEKYEGRLLEMERLHSEEIQLLVQESLAVLQSQSVHGEADRSSRDVSPGGALLDSSMEDSALMEASLSETLQKALKDLRLGSNAVLKASTQLNGVSVSEGFFFFFAVESNPNTVTVKRNSGKILMSLIFFKFCWHQKKNRKVFRI